MNTSVGNTVTNSNDTSNVGISTGVIPLVVAPIVAPPTTVISNSVPHGKKLEKFIGVEFKRWHQKMLFSLTTLNLTKFLNEDPPTIQEGENNRASLIVLDA
ncbi:CCHC-type domain-containing protein [Abeliophyllum distichum]|uniref:CCHC-type domain-containing protein n=1 Tax=Abeliophyllum distichum TaxID=126358 RepID=A0ABD1U0E1_9LAMI